MPFIRQTRDKRGFEHTYVMHAGRPGPGSQRPRVLYVFRTPGNLRVGRQALDPEVREALEHTHPDLSFDWNALTREAVIVRPDPAPQRQQQKGARPRGPEPAPTPPVLEDSSLLGRVVGAGTAARFRSRFNDVSQRIMRRARTPEERDALLERLATLNPDHWPDEETVRSHASSLDGDLDRIAAELPSRRRGRRGGRHRHEHVRTTGQTEQSGIMANGDEHHENQGDSGGDRHDDPDSGAGAFGPADPAPDLPGDD